MGTDDESSLYRCTACSRDFPSAFSLEGHNVRVHRTRGGIQVVNPAPAEEPEGSSEREREEVADEEELPIIKDGGLIRVEGIDYRLGKITEKEVELTHVYWPDGEKVRLVSGAQFRIEGCEDTFIAP